MNDTLLMCVLHRKAHLNKEPNPLAEREVVMVAIFDDRRAADPLHHEVRLAGLRGPGIEHFGDGGVLHDSKGLSLCFEAGHDLLRVHAELDDF